MDMMKRGQVTIYVIVAIVIVGLVIIGVLFFPNLRDIVIGGEFTPQEYLRTCIEPKVLEGVELLSAHGGYASPEGFIVHGDKKVKYLCYSAEYYKTCVVQQPMIKNNYEKELNAIVQSRAEDCVRDLKQEYENRGYSVSSSSGVSSKVVISPGAVSVNFEAPMTVTKDTSDTFREFKIGIDSEIYDLLLTAQSIIDFESTYGDSETSLYLQYYPDLKIEKTKLGDGTTIYKLSNVVTQDEFVFASRSLAWPPGYGFET